MIMRGELPHKHGLRQSGKASIIPPLCFVVHGEAVASPRQEKPSGTNKTAAQTLPGDDS